MLKPSKTTKLAKARADKYFSEYIRLRDKDKMCVTCFGGGVNDCGHFISRRFEATRFDEKNSNGQCIKCNRFQYGNQFEHGQAIDRMYGEGTAAELLQKSKMTCKRSRFDFDHIAQEYKDKIHELTYTLNRYRNEKLDY